MHMLNILAFSPCKNKPAWNINEYSDPRPLEGILLSEHFIEY